MDSEINDGIEKMDKHTEVKLSNGVSYLTALLVCFMFLASVNGVFVEQSNLAYASPEGLSLPSYISVISQVPNIIVLVYLLLRKCLKQQTLQHYAILLTSITSGVSLVLMSLFWKETVPIFGEEHSIPFFILVFFGSFYDCISNVTVLPFMSLLPSRYLSPLYVGQALSYFVPGVTVLIQGQYEGNSTNTVTPTNNLRFSVEGYFVFLGCIMFLCPISYLTILYLPSIRKLHVRNFEEDESYQSLSTLSNSVNVASSNAIQCRRIHRSTFHVVCLLSTLFGVVFLQIGILWSILSYALSPYGAIIYNLGVTVGTIVCALVCLSYYWYPINSTRLAYLLSVLFTGLVTYLFIIALKYPNPWLKEELSGKLIALFAAIISMSIATYIRMIIIAILGSYKKRYLLYCGIIVQLASFLGSVFTFLVINFTPCFHS